jgi:ATP-dependent protease ClpP protease subunit
LWFWLSPVRSPGAGACRAAPRRRISPASPFPASSPATAARSTLIKSLEDSRASAVLLSIDSPGGTVTGSEALYEAIRRLAAKKPVVAVVDGMAASGGYIVALGGERIVARQTSPVGSIGVVAPDSQCRQAARHDRR